MMPHKPPYNLGSIEMCSEDLSWHPEAFHNPWLFDPYQLEELGQAKDNDSKRMLSDEGLKLINKGWRLPTFHEAEYLGQLHELDIGGFTIGKEYDKECYWVGHDYKGGPFTPGFILRASPSPKYVWDLLWYREEDYVVDWDTPPRSEREAVQRERIKRREIEENAKFRVRLVRNH